MKGSTPFALGSILVFGAGIAAAKEKPFEIKIPASCGPVALTGADKIKKKDDDVILFRFVNECPQPRQVAVCAVPLTPGALKPWDDCLGLPPEEPTVGTPFTIPAATTTDPAVTAYALCSVAYGTNNQKFCVFAISGPPDTTLTCPATYQCTRERASEIAIEVEP